MKKIICLLSIGALSVAAGFAHKQEAGAKAQPSPYEEKLNRVFQEWERPDRPGGVVAVVEKGEVVYKRCFGRANVEYALPNTPHTVFDAGPLAEAVTGMAIAMLEEEGRLSAADPLKKYLPELPAWKDSLTVAHLLYHTSGLSDVFDILPLAGWNDGDTITSDQLLKLASRQQELVFAPGTKMSASRTDYLLLAEIVRRVTGQAFRDWTWENIFKPLGMTRTLFRENYREVIEDRAYSINYHSREGYLKGMDGLAAAGPLCLFTTLEDFIRWLVNLETPRVGSVHVREKLLTSGRLNDGGDAGHSYGLAVDSQRGLKRVDKSGSWGGFRAAFRYYPEASFGVFVFANWDYGWNDPAQHADNVAMACLEGRMEKPKGTAAPAAPKKARTMSPEALAQFEGEYRQGRTYLFVTVEKGVPLFKVPGQTFRLVPTGEAEFSFEDPNIPIVLVFSKGADGKVTQMSFNAGMGDVVAPKVTRERLTPEDLKRYEGTYSCEELDARYQIRAGEGRLVLGSLRTGDVVLMPENRSTFVGSAPGLQLLKFLIDEDGKVQSFRVDSDDLRHLVFRKQ
jgi:CubicO group peptidase (beta-lactamase class C family)